MLNPYMVAEVATQYLTRLYIHYDTRVRTETHTIMLTIPDHHPSQN